MSLGKGIATLGICAMAVGMVYFEHASVIIVGFMAPFCILVIWRS